MKLREVYKDHGRFKKQAKTLQKWLLKTFSQKNQYKKIFGQLSPYIQFPQEGISVVSYE